MNNKTDILLLAQFLSTKKIIHFWIFIGHPETVLKILILYAKYYKIYIFIKQKILKQNLKSYFFAYIDIVLKNLTSLKKGSERGLEKKISLDKNLFGSLISGRKNKWPISGCPIM